MEPGPAWEDKERTEAMRGVKYAVLKNPDDLTERRSAALAMLADADPPGGSSTVPGGSRNSLGPSCANPSNGSEPS